MNHICRTRHLRIDPIGSGARLKLHHGRERAEVTAHQPEQLRGRESISPRVGN